MLLVNPGYKMTTGWLLLSRFILNMWYKDIPQPHSWCFFDHQPPRCVSTCSNMFFFSPEMICVAGHLHFFVGRFFHLDEGGLNISGSGGVAAPTRPLNLCFGGGVERCDFLENFNWSWSIRQPVLFTGRNVFFFHSRLQLCFFSREGTSMKWLHSQRKEHWSNEFRKRSCCEQGFS